jgi:hypothetical protein
MVIVRARLIPLAMSGVLAVGLVATQTVRGSSAHDAAAMAAERGHADAASSPVGTFRVAQSPPAQAPAPAVPEPAAPPVASPPPAAPARQSDAEVVLVLTRTTLIALHQANVTGNDTVLRDLGAPGFRDKNSAADLGKIFAPIREAKIDLSQVVLLDPHISRATLTSNKMLNIAGAVETKPHPVNFELLFEAVHGVWRVFGISVTPVQAINPVAPPQMPAPTQRSTKPKRRSQPKSAKPKSAPLPLSRPN